jgi:hypothetical protein
MLEIWPPLPIVIRACGIAGRDLHNQMDNTNVALGQTDRICQLDLIAILKLEKVLAVIQKPFPLLTHLKLEFRGKTPPLDPDSFLGGSAPGLKSLSLSKIPLPGLPNLLLSATHLVNLELDRIPDSGYISPEAMVTGLSALTRLETLAITFLFFQSRPDRESRPLPPQTRILLPVLTRWLFSGDSEYLDDLMARIDAPLLDKLAVTLFPKLIMDTPELTHFISRTPGFKSRDELEARVFFPGWGVEVTLFDRALYLAILCEEPDQRLTFLAQVCRSTLPRSLILAVEDLYILDENRVWNLDFVDIEDSQWPQIFDPFTAVKNLYLSWKFVPYIVLALQELVGETGTEGILALQTLFLEETPQSRPVQDSIELFVASRSLAGIPIAVSRWENDIDK